jgi:hypothetical protein
LLVRAIVPLSDREELLIGAIDSAAIEDQLDLVTPPMIVLLPPDLAFQDGRRFESYEISLTLGDASIPGVAHYGTLRDLVFAPAADGNATSHSRP